MKKYILSIMMLAGALATQAQEAPTTGFLLPRMTTAQKTALVNPAKGLTIYNTDTNVQEINTGTAAAPVWSAVSAGSNVKWVDDIDNNVVLNSTVALDSVKYSNSGYKLFDKTNTSYTFWRASTSAHETFDIKTFNFRNLYHNNASKLVTINPTFNDYTNNAFYGIVDQSDTHVGKSIYNIQAKQIVDNANSNNYASIYGTINTSEHYGSGTVSTMIGSYNPVIVGPSATATSTIGAYGQITNFSANPMSSSYAGFFYNAMRGTGSITNLYGVYTQIDGTNSTSNVTNLYGGLVNLLIPNTYTGTITNLYGININPNGMGNTTNVTNEYGLFISNLKRGSANRFAIYTNDGLVYFKDKVGMGTTAPAVKLDINDATIQEALRVTTGTDGRILGIRGELLDFKRNGSNYIGASGASGNFIFVTGGDATNTLYQRMFITSTGNVGIGVSVPLAKLHTNETLAGGLTTPLILSNTSSDANSEVELRFGASTGPAIRYSSISAINNGSNGIALKFTTGEGSIITEKMRITPAGNVGVGVIAPVEKLEVAGAIKIGSTSAATPTAGTIRFNTTSNKFEGYNGTAWVEFH